MIGANASSLVKTFFSLCQETPQIQATNLGRLNDVATADLILRVVPTNEILFCHKAVLQKNPYFASFEKFAEANGYAEIDPPDSETFAFCIEFLYRAEDTHELYQEIVSSHLRLKFGSIMQNAAYFMMQELLDKCYLVFPEIWKKAIEKPEFGHEKVSIVDLEGLLEACSGLNQYDKLKIILEWSTGLKWNYDRNELHRIVSKTIIPASDKGRSLNLKTGMELSDIYSSAMDIAVPGSVFFKIAAVKAQVPRKGLCPSCKPNGYNYNLDINGTCASRCKQTFYED